MEDESETEPPAPRERGNSAPPLLRTFPLGQANPRGACGVILFSLARIFYFSLSLLSTTYRLSPLAVYEFSRRREAPVETKPHVDTTAKPRRYTSGPCRRDEKERERVSSPRNTLGD